MSDLSERASLLFHTFHLELPGGFSISPNYWQAIAIVFLLFLLILTMGQLRHRLLDWHMKGFFPGIIFGFILALILEGFLIIGGRSALSAVFGWKNPPRPVEQALDGGRARLVQVLGEQVSVSEQADFKGGAGGVYKIYTLLQEDEQTDFRSIVCRE